MEEIYLDNAATTFPKPECVYQAMDEIARTGAVNAGRGSYALARQASGLIESTRKQIKELALPSTAIMPLMPALWTAV